MDKQKIIQIIQWLMIILLTITLLLYGQKLKDRKQRVLEQKWRINKWVSQISKYSVSIGDSTAKFI